MYKRAVDEELPDLKKRAKKGELPAANKRAESDKLPEKLKREYHIKGDLNSMATIPNSPIEKNPVGRPRQGLDRSTTVNYPPAWVKAITAWGKSQNLNLSDMLREALLDYMEKHGIPTSF